jgi:hypothetical protein
MVIRDTRRCFANRDRGEASSFNDLSNHNLRVQLSKGIFVLGKLSNGSRYIYNPIGDPLHALFDWAASKEG